MAYTSGSRSWSESVADWPDSPLLLDEDRGDAVRLNTRELVGATYINRIRRLVNFYWDQNLDNLPSSVRYARPSYTTVVVVVLDDGDEHLTPSMRLLITLQPLQELDEPMPRPPTLRAHSNDQNRSETAACAALAARKATAADFAALLVCYRTLA